MGDDGHLIFFPGADFDYRVIEFQFYLLARLCRI
jgi:hypothetical protein